MKNNFLILLLNRGHKIFIFLFMASVFLLSSSYIYAQSKPKIYIKTLKNKHYQLIVEKKPFVVKGICYNPIPIGEGPEYSWWEDPASPWLVDGKLMKEGGFNVVRIYQPPLNSKKFKQVIIELYRNFGIYTVLGHWLGFWEYPCPDYSNPEFQKKIEKEVLSMVNYYKDTPGLLFWILGNENNYSFSGKVNPWCQGEIDQEPDPQKQKFMRAKLYYSFVNELAKKIKAIDSAHPIGLGNGELTSLEVAKDYAPDVDFIACIIYRGKTFGNLFNSLRVTFDKPILLSEFGADSYDAYKQKEDQDIQAFILEAQWNQIYQNLANNKLGAGNCIGGIVFEWVDEWWKHTEYDKDSWKIHDTEAGWTNPAYYFDIQAKGNKNMNEEWFGLVSISEELENGINKRIPKKAYYVLRELFRNKEKKR